MFEAMGVAFGQYRLFKIEDCGRVHSRDAFKIPDFRIVLNDGSQWLIEVKNLYQNTPFVQPFTIREQDISKLNHYAAEMRCELKIAIFWSRWNVWTLVSPAELRKVGNKFQIEFEQALQISGMLNLGDMSIGTTSPLRLRLLADTSKLRILGEDDTANMTIGGVKAFSEQREICDPLEQAIFFKLIEFGRWVCKGPTAVMDESQQLAALEYTWEPEEASDQGFDFIGQLSSLFSKYYARQTVRAGEIVQIEAEFIPDWFDPLMSKDHKSSALPLWRFLIQPNRKKPLRSPAP
jgi:hypothetical protein